MLITYLRSLLEQLHRDQEGQTAVEYALVLALIAVVIVGAVAAGLQLALPQILQQVTGAL